MTQKTNQFNLTTRRYGEDQIQDFIVGADWLVADFSLSDVFGHSGVAGMAVLKMLDKHTAEVDTLLMSCRVIGRCAESAFLHCLLRRLGEQGIKEVIADFIPTVKNELVKTFLPEQGFDLRSDGRYYRNLVEKPASLETAFPITVSTET
jgi:FkbH-like protein